MNAKDRTEEVLKSIHVLFSKAEPVEGGKKRVIIDKSRMLALLKDLNDCMYAMMDEYELTEQSRDKAMRKVQQKSDDLVFDARKNAEDIYAASIMYTDHALDRIQELIADNEEKVETRLKEMKEEFEINRQTLKDNQLELKNQLSSLIESQKYLKLIEAENERLKKESQNKEEDAWDDAPAKVVPEIIINEEYFKEAGLEIEKPESTQEQEAEMPVPEDPDIDLPEIDISEISLDGDAFSEILDENEEEPQEVKKGFFGFGRKS